MVWSIVLSSIMMQSLLEFSDGVLGDDGDGGEDEANPGNLKIYSNS